MKRDVQTANKTIQLTQNLATSTKRKKEISEVKHKRIVTFTEARKLVGSYMGENTKALLCYDLCGGFRCYFINNFGLQN